MVSRIIGKKVIELSVEKFRGLFSGYEKVMVDLGTGDGKFAYNYAKEHPQVFVIGIDADKRQMVEISHKTNRKPAKGGLPNVIYIWTSVEQLPAELAGVADEIYINFPWGSLLCGLVIPNADVLGNLQRLAKPKANISMHISYSEKFEPETVVQWHLPKLSLDLFSELRDIYERFGLVIGSIRELTEEEKISLASSWPKRILDSRKREVFAIKCRQKD